MRWNHIFSERLFSNFTGVVSHYKYQIGNLEGGQRADWNADILNINLKADFTHFLNPLNRLDFGMNLFINRYEPGRFRPDTTESNLNAFNLERENSVEPAIYFSDEFAISGRFTLNYGLRYSLFHNLT